MCSISADPTTATIMYDWDDHGILHKETRKPRIR